jgi:predicted TPR repeat methyltransferase
VVPEHPEALHYSGILAHQQGRSTEGIALIRRSLEIGPDRADCYSNLGIIFKAQGRIDDAVEAYQRAIALRPDHANAYSNLGVLLRAQGKLAEAEDAYRTAVRLNPGHVDAYHNLGVLLESDGRTSEAVWCYCKVTTLTPWHPEARRLMALAHVKLGELDKARALFQEWVDKEPENPVALHMLAACSGQNVPARASDAFVEKTFDAFATSFDEKLAYLAYRAPQLVAAMLSDSGIVPSKSLDVLDAGCGTGLCGPLVAPYARRLVGVDLSAKMMELARDRHVYDDLIKGELTAFLQQSAGQYDLIVSADTLVYFGALEAVLSAAAAALRANGMLIFSLEENTEPDATAPYRLETHGRYNHRQTYVEQLLSEVGLRPEVVRAELRMESGVPVAGMVIRATKGVEVSHG